MLASERIANALRVVHNRAVEIAANRGRILENGGGLGCPELATMGDIVNNLVRLSVVALFEEDVEHAELVQRYRGVGQLFGPSFYDWYRTLDHGARAQAEFERAIAKHLRQIVLQAYETAGAIVFWLDDPPGNFASDTAEHTFTYPARQDRPGAGKRTDYDHPAIYAYRSAMPTSKPGADAQNVLRVDCSALGGLLICKPLVLGS